MAKLSDRKKYCVGQTFNGLQIVEDLGLAGKFKARYIMAKCHCATIFKSRLSHIVYGKTRSCGCTRYDHRLGQPAHNRKPNGYSYGRQIWNRYKNKAETNNMEFVLTVDYFIELIQRNCYYCDESPNQNYYKFSGPSRHGSLMHHGVDRKNNDLGYTLENSVSCCKICNRAKMDSNVVEFVTWALKLSANLEKKTA